MSLSECLSVCARTMLEAAGGCKNDQQHATTRRSCRAKNVQRAVFLDEAQQCATGRDFAPQLRRRLGVAVLPPARRTPAPNSVISKVDEVTHPEHVVDRVGIGVVDVARGFRQNGDDVVGAGVSEIASGHCVGDVGGR